MQRSGRIGRDILWALSWTVSCGIAAILLASLTYAAAGSQPFARAGVTYPRMLAFYVVGSVAFGVLLGLLRPFTSQWWGRSVVGTVIASVGLLGLHLVGNPNIRAWDGRHWQSVIIPSILAGPVCGWMIPRLARQLYRRGRQANLGDAANPLT